MENEKPITVLMSVYNGEKYLKQAVESILNQTFRDFEFLIINDASTDNSLNILKSYNDSRIKIMTNEKNLGLTKSLNKGLKLAQGRYIARMDDDDISFPARLEKQFGYMEEHQNTALCGSLAYIINEKGERIGEKNLAVKDIKKRLLFNNQFIHSALFLCKEALDEAGYYNEDFERAQDYELVLRIASKFQVANLDEKLVSWRRRKGSLSGKKQQKFALKARWRAITKYGYPKAKGIFHILLRIVQLAL